MTKKGTHLSEEAKNKIRVKLWGRRCCMSTEFKKGNIPFNKGTKGLMKKNKTSFKKGNKPSNYMGGIKCMKDGIYVITKNNFYGKNIHKYENLARKKWREAYGDFDKKLILFHKDRDVFNCELDNLELITRAELLRRNSRKEKHCIICGKSFISKTGYHKTCGYECYKQNCKNLNKIWVKKHRLNKAKDLNSSIQ